MTPSGKVQRVLVQMQPPSSCIPALGEMPGFGALITPAACGVEPPSRRGTARPVPVLQNSLVARTV